MNGQGDYNFINGSTNDRNQMKPSGLHYENQGMQFAGKSHKESDKL